MTEYEVKQKLITFERAISKERKRCEGGAILVINFAASAVSGKQAKGLWDFAMSIGYKRRFGIEPKFNPNRRYTFERTVDNHGNCYIAVIRERNSEQNNGTT